ncbi:hypothetical protein EOM33_03110 [Candidatus Saccharibacteria bacterium]|nr:hypothetical protein [Candidatus Saccharibacteria bacterium]
MDNIPETKRMMKVLVRVKHKPNEPPRWTHLCYLPDTLYQRYFFGERQGFERLRQQIIKWLKQDYGISVKLDTKKAIVGMKAFITNTYKKEYKQLFPKDGIIFSKSGWFSLWLIKHMEMELEDADE